MKKANNCSIYRKPWRSLTALFAVLLVVCLAACARMGNPDGGWYDETPPHVVGAEPADQGTNVKQRKIRINFNEVVKIYRCPKSKPRVKLLK